MHLKIEKLHHLFDDLKNNIITASQFFDAIWPITIYLPKNELRNLLDEVYKWAEMNSGQQPGAFSLATFALSFISYHQEQYEDVLKFNLEAQKLFAAEDDKDGLAVCSAVLGAAYRTLGNIDLALTSFMEATEQLERSGRYKVFNIFMCYNTAGILTEIGHYEESIRMFQQTLELSESNDMKNISILALTGIGEIYRIQKQYKLAQRFLDKAYALCLSEGAVPVISRVLTDIGVLYMETDNLDKAEECHKEALHLREQAKIYGGAVTNMIKLSEIYMIREKDPEAVIMLNRALDLSEQIKVKPKIFAIHLLLSEIYEKQNDLAKSHFHFKIYEKVKTEVNFEDGEKKIKNLRLVFEAEQTKKENAIIKAQKAEIEAKNIALQETIDELTLTKISRKAKVITFTITIILFVIEDTLKHFFLYPYVHHNFLFSLSISGVILLCIKPVEKAVEHYLLNKFVMNKKHKNKSETLIIEENVLEKMTLNN